MPNDKKTKWPSKRAKEKAHENQDCQRGHLVLIDLIRKLIDGEVFANHFSIPELGLITPNGGHHRRGQHHAICLQTNEPCWVSPVHAIVGWRKLLTAPTERRHRACAIERKRSCLHDGFSVAEPLSLVFKNGGFTGNREKIILKILPQPNDRHHRFAKRRTNYPSLMLPAEANPRAWHGWPGSKPDHLPGDQPGLKSHPGTNWWSTRFCQWVN